MWSFFRKKVLIIILVSIILLVTLIGFTMRNREEVSLPEELLKDTIGWVQSVFRVPTNFVIDFFTDVNDLKSTYEQNEVLNEHLSEYKDLLYEVQVLKEENEELRGILEIEETLRDFHPIYATVNSRSPELWVEQVTINKGKQHGVEPNMAVRTADGMIGKVKTAYQFTSTIQLLSGFDINNRVSVMIQGNEEKDNTYGLIEGYDQEKEALILTVKSAELQEGELVVTSGLGGVFPAGIPIGEIQSIETDPYGLTNIGYIKPAADLYDLNQVIVIDRDVAAPEENAELEEEE
ncbi:rod shape-determining protein MreC [Salirhabdus sp. Marseille-P4669]|uniref:rod shape-determining protein MreC n=1 Tax=Salirhabdus sp. Marseille-P4669 TaxID=2042310 RepID=UPI000C7CB5B8|nr:rod shape-determining protein MreC [Salirhabdus sp. Marseille-P4669]